MAKKSARIQVRLTPKMHEWLADYQQENDHQFMSDAIIDLLSFAIRIKENAKDDDSISNRELLEEILHHVLITEKVARSTFGYSYEEGKLSDKALKDKAKGLVEDLVEKAGTMKDTMLIKQ